MPKTGSTTLHIELICLFCLTAFVVEGNALVNTISLRNIERHNYPVQEHLVQTSDGYILKVYRIPPTPTATTTAITDSVVAASAQRSATTNNSSSSSQRGVVLLQHGFTLSSDVWLLRGPSADLPFLLADAGYDVWLGNQRGNKYARRHSALDVSADASQFWNFTWHEMGYHDLADTVDYVLAETQSPALHYVGYSQGGLVALVLLATRPAYATKLQSLQFMAPTAYMQNVQVPLARWRNHLAHYYGRLVQWSGHAEALHFARMNVYQRMCAWICAERSWLRPLCLKVYAFIAGAVEPQESYEQLMPAICGTLPAGVSNKQLLHYLQLFKSGAVQQFDYGSASQNRLQYGQDTPPHYAFDGVRNCITIYYSEADYLCAAADVHQLGAVLPCAELRLLPHAWNHGDFVWSRHVRQTLHAQILDEIMKWHESV